LFKKNKNLAKTTDSHNIYPKLKHGAVDKQDFKPTE